MRHSGSVTSVTLVTLIAGLISLGGPVSSAREAVSAGPVRVEAFSMLALTWRGERAPDAEVRTRDADGWSDWSRLDPLADGGEPTDTRGTELRWVGPSEAAQLRTTGPRPPGLKLVLIDPGTRPGDARVSSYAGRRAGAPQARPDLLGRAAWGADNSLRNGSPSYSSKLKQVHLHHTATGNDYAPEDVPAIIRGMYSYHTRSLGWFDLGYNFLVDRFGRTWVGRSGGAWKLVTGAHTLGFNHNSVGVAVIGDFETSPPTREALTAVVRLAAWKLDRHGRRSASGWATVTSKGSDRYAPRTRLRLPVIDGHRDTNETACPGTLLYERIDDIRKRAQKRLKRLS